MSFWEQIQRSLGQWSLHLGKLKAPEEVIWLPYLKVQCMRMKNGDLLFVGRQLATGYFGIVYSACIVEMQHATPQVIAKDFVLKRTTASWTMFHDLPVEMLHEADQMKALYPKDRQHIQAFLFEGRPALLMPKLGHKTLEDRLRESPPLSLQQKVDITLQICNQLLSLHRKNRIHADLQSANIVLDSSQASLVDLGHSRPVNQTGRMGAAGYPTLDALGASLFKRLSTTKIDIAALGHLIKEIFEQEVPARKGLQDLIHRCTAFRPSVRPDLPVVIEELNAIFAGINPRPGISRV